MNEWLGVLRKLNAAGEDSVLVTVASGKGSTPRDAGTKMVVGAVSAGGTVGGGELEFQAIGTAREMLRERQSVRARRFPLGARLGQSCGGSAHLVFEHVPPGAAWVREVGEVYDRGEACVTATPIEGSIEHRLIVTGNTDWGSLGHADLDRDARHAGRELLADANGGARVVPLGERGAISILIDPIRPSDFRIQLHGAGHVGRALARVLGATSCELEWVDGRAHEFPDVVAGNVRMVLTDQPAASVDRARPGTYFLAMTHSHALDFEIVERVLARGDFAFCGMIGSATKRRSLAARVAKHSPGLNLDRLTCPIGIDGLSGKEPGTIAVAVAAQLLMLREAARAGVSAVPG